VDLPARVAWAAERWGLSHLRPVPELSYNFVAFANRGLENVVLKVGVPHDELLSEIAALEFYAGQEAARLLESEASEGIFLIERLQPGTMLATMEDDEAATSIAAGLMHQLWRPAPEQRGQFILLRNWFDGFNRLRLQFDGNTGPLPPEWVERAEGIVKTFFAERQPDVLLHGDLHHYNILASGQGWKVIDPKGVIGPAEYEIGPLMINPWGRVLNGEKPHQRAARRLAILSERLGVERRRLCDWAIAHAVLSAWWSVESNEDWRYTIRCAELFADLD
jgi:streptomycin 6-kinase